jgi:hypothetical protein
MVCGGGGVWWCVVSMVCGGGAVERRGVHEGCVEGVKGVRGCKGCMEGAKGVYLVP